jgi:hypothetical protein
MSHPSALALVAAVLLPSFAAAASEIAVTTATGVELVHEGAVGGGTRGYAFTPSQDIFVDGVGIWDEGGDGLQQDHRVGIWDSGMNLLVSSTVQAGSTSPILGTLWKEAGSGTRKSHRSCSTPTPSM